MKKAICVVLALMLVVLATGLIACGPTVADNTEHFDDITKSLKLTKSYAGKSFLADGIGSATVDENGYTDGDTTRFKLTQGNVVIVRYYCIDTPESTGKIEKWGKAASLFVKQQLSQATEIVLEATATPAVHDSYGTRYLGYVWYKTADYAEFKNLNLELIENGYTESKAINTSSYPYFQYMDKAEKFARSIKLRNWSDLADPLYSTEPVEMTIKDFWENTDVYYTAETDSGAKVEFVACLTSIYISESQTHTYTATQYDPETGKTYTLSVYCAYTSSPSSRMEVGHLYRIVGNVQNYYGKFQISGIAYDEIFGANNPAYTTEKQYDYYLTFDSNLTYNFRYARTLYTDATVVSTSLDGSTLTIVATATQRTSNGTKGEAITFTFKVNATASQASALTVGRRFSVAGFQLVKDSHEINVVNYSDIKLR